MKGQFPLLHKAHVFQLECLMLRFDLTTIIIITFILKPSNYIVKLALQWRRQLILDEKISNNIRDEYSTCYSMGRVWAATTIQHLYTRTFTQFRPNATFHFAVIKCIHV